MLSHLLKKLVLFTILIVGVIFNSGALHASEGVQAPISLYIVFVDGKVIEKNQVPYLETIFTRELNGVNQHYLVIETQSQEFAVNRAETYTNPRGIALTRAQILKWLAEQNIQPRTIKYLTILTHGNTKVIKSKTAPFEKYVSQILHVGEFDETKVSDEFDLVLGPLVPFVRNDLSLVFETCSTFCGPQDEAKKRMHTLMKYFGNFEGQIFGSTQLQTTLAEVDIKNFALPSPLRVGAFLLSQLAIGLYLKNSSVDHELGGQLAASLLIAAGIFTRQAAVLATIVATKLRLLNQGLVAKSGSENSLEVLPVNRVNDFELVYPVSCKNAFGTKKP